MVMGADRYGTGTYYGRERGVTRYVMTEVRPMGKEGMVTCLFAGQRYRAGKV